MNNKYQASATFIPQFSYIDLMGVLWHGHYPKLLEMARDKIFSNFNYGYMEMKRDNLVFPIVDMRIKYKRPILLQQEVKIIATLVEMHNRIKCEYEIHDVKTNELLTKAYTIQVAFNMLEHEMLFETPKPILDLFSWTFD